MIKYRNIAKGGMCDRTFGFTFANAVAQIRKEILAVNWSKSTACPFEFNEIFDYPDTEVLVNVRNRGDVTLSFNGCWGLPLCSNHKKLYHKYNDLINVSYEDFCEVHMKCISELPLKKLSGYYENLHECIGVHFRHTDVRQLRKFSHDQQTFFYEGFLQALLGMNESSYYVCSDNEKSRNALVVDLRRHGKTVYFNHGVVYDSSELRQTPVIDVIYDIVSLSKCKTRYGNVTSGITQMSSIMSNTYSLRYYSETMRGNHKSFYKNWRNRYEQ